MSSAVVDDGGLEDSELQLGLGLSVGGGNSRVVTNKDLGHGSVGGFACSTSCSSSSKSSGCSSTSSSSPLVRAEKCVGVKRSADPAADGGGVNQVVGWPPVRAYRMSSMGNQARVASTCDFNSVFGTHITKSSLEENSRKGLENRKDGAKEKECQITSPFVKVNVDGNPIGRKVDLNAFKCYEDLAQTLEDMFFKSQQLNSISIENNMTKEETQPASRWMLTYEDKEGDWMLVGDVPWRMFLNSVKRLRVMKTSTANVPVVHTRN